MIRYKMEEKKINSGMEILREEEKSGVREKKSVK
jgi:hypothetical protein